MKTIPKRKHKRMSNEMQGQDVFFKPASLALFVIFTKKNFIFFLSIALYSKGYIHFIGVVGITFWQII
jgi:hypothetical protein